MSYVPFVDTIGDQTSHTTRHMLIKFIHTVNICRTIQSLISSAIVSTDLGW